ncbi:MAG: hypothetical protein K2X66_14900 [Cyanobacteria bacterium]|nr:hypothetical protein [Cyanobacteriota bacterium]
MSLLSTINPENFANQWTQRVTGSMKKMGVPEEEVAENTTILFSLIKTGTELLIQEPEIKLPALENIQGLNLPEAKEFMALFTTQAPLQMTPERLNQIIELFIRSINQMSKTLKSRGLPWEERKYILEQAAWETFNLSKTLVSIYHMPRSIIKSLDAENTLLQEMIKEGTQETLKRFLNKPNAGGP